MIKNILLFWCLVNVTLSYGQDFTFSQLPKIPFLLNPASVNFGKNYRIGVNYRNQTSVSSVSYESYTLWADANIRPKYMNTDWFSVGVLGMSDQNLGYRTFNASGNIAYHHLLNEHSTISLGTSAGYVNKAMITNKLIFEDQFNGFIYDNSITSQEYISKGAQYFSLGVGINYFNQLNQSHNFSLGVAAYHINAPKQSLISIFNKTNGGNTVLAETIPVRYNIYSTFNSKLSDKIVLRNEAYITKQGSIMAGIVGSGISLNLSDPNQTIIYGGLAYKFNTAMVLNLSTIYKDIQLGISYDIYFSKTNNFNHYHNAIEVGVIYNFDFVEKSDHKKNKTVQCKPLF